ncbi:hypothetical protein ACH5RR_008236 [Cinchona calisaya]|uniref:Uncharacterized protein n=1 Tax=Cinchona calisaya TaxID=153742 RepID=A0ABD3AB09_9GENT
MLFRKPIMYVLEAPKHDDAALNGGASKTDMNVGTMRLICMVSHFMSDANVELHDRTEANSKENIEDGNETLNGGTTESSETVEGGVNSGRPMRLMTKVNSKGNIEDGNGTINGGTTVGGEAVEDSANSRESVRLMCMVSHLDDYIDYGKPPPKSQVLDGEQGAAQEAASNQGASAEFQRAGNVGSSGNEFQRACPARSAGANQAQAHTEDEHV